MNTDTMELDLNEMETVNGGVDWDRFASHFEWRDAAGVLLFGPIGELMLLGKVIDALELDD